ncbi:MAG: hypothetical protein A2096_06910 [Spirochaetes bacterium GWF1_41_5]|nr:MAG: hypothetical protein A2096_06910 [Spirochaetes bacterium GWF1_41_5]HBE04416.1 hypothetical protein [Spirochaetia bacterium]
MEKNTNRFYPSGCKYRNDLSSFIAKVLQSAGKKIKKTGNLLAFLVFAVFLNCLYNTVFSRESSCST